MGREEKTLVHLRGIFKQMQLLSACHYSVKETSDKFWSAMTMLGVPEKRHGHYSQFFDPVTVGLAFAGQEVLLDVTVKSAKSHKQ